MGDYDLDTLRALKEKIDQATGPDREIDASIARLFDSMPREGDGPFDWKYVGGGTWHQDEFNQPHPGYNRNAEKYTASIDAALALVGQLGLPGIVIMREAIRMTSGDADRLARCLISAAIAALIAQQEAHNG